MLLNYSPESTPPRYKQSVLLVGNFLSSKNGNPSVGEELEVRLKEIGWSVMITSNKRARLYRLLDMVGTAWTRRGNYQTAQVDVFSGPAFAWAESVCTILRLAQRNYILTLHGGNLPQFAERWPNRVRRLLNSAWRVTTPSLYLKEKLRRYRADLLVLPNPIAIDSYIFRLRKRPAPSLVWLRAFHRIYNPQLAPQVMKFLHASYPKASLRMIGPDKGDGSLNDTRQIALDLGISKWIKFLGKIPKCQVPASLQAADIFINTSNADNTPISVIEAMASGLCIVSTNVGGIPYLLEHEKDALLVPPDDPDAMASAICRLMEEPELAETLSVNARKKAEQFDWSKILPQWHQLFLKAVDPHTDVT